MENRSVEHGLAQKLMVMENAVARIATIRAQLRTNTDQARKEIRSVMSQQMLLLRAREQELLDELDVVSNYRERSLEHQQQLLYRNIWECKQAQKKSKENSSSGSEADEVFSRLCHVETTVQDCAYISFESDAIGLRSTLLSFGNIRTIAERDKANKGNRGESLPMELEEDDDNAVMAHKSVLRVNSSPTISCPMSKQQVDSVRKWLKRIPSVSSVLGTDMSSIMNEFDVIKNTAFSEIDSSDSSSFDTIANDSAESSISTKIDKVLSAEFLNTLRQPLSSWLIRAKQKEQQIYSDMKRSHSCVDEKKSYEFEDIIKNIRASNDENWILGSESGETRDLIMCTDEQTSTNEQESSGTNATNSSGSDMLDVLTKLYGCHIKCAPQSDMKGRPSTQDIDLSTVLGWKRVLNRIDQSTSFWLQDRRP